jgi:hypothetical protein
MPCDIPGLTDGDRGNVLISSKRSNMTFFYMVHPITNLISKLLILYLRVRTGVWLDGSLNSYCSPINIYYEGSFIKEHRDRNMISGNYIQYIAVLTLKAPIKGGQFVYNDDPLMIVEDKGKTVVSRPLWDGICPVQAGSLLFLDNSKTSHKTLPVIEGQRISLAFRSRY